MRIIWGTGAVGLVLAPHGLVNYVELLRQAHLRSSKHARFFGFVDQG